MKKHIFIIGDLTVDHDVFVRSIAGSPYDSFQALHRFEVTHRQDTAGGAANSARILAVLNEGETFLWGVVGRSHWGTFRAILEHSNAIDGAQKVIELRGVQDETDPPIDTVTRLLRADGTEVDRFYDVRHMHVPDEKRLVSVLYHLDHIRAKGLDVIIINDFDKHCLDTAIVTRIGRFATEHDIPLFVDPKVDSDSKERDKYSGLRDVMAILPNLEEWCQLVSSKRGPRSWRDNLHNDETLREMAQLSFKHLGNFRNYIVKCDKDGAVLILQHPTLEHHYAIFLIPPVPTRKRFVHQTGSGDIMTAVFAAEFNCRGDRSQTFEAALAAFLKANAVVACYWESGWHRMPSRAAVEEKQAETLSSRPEPRSIVFNGMQFLPNEGVVRMSSSMTELPGIYSQDQKFHETIHDVIKDVLENWERGNLKSVILGAPPGTGKTTTINVVKEKCARQGICAVELGDDLRKLTNRQHRDEYYEQEIRKIPAPQKHLLVIVDEARKEGDLTQLSAWSPLFIDPARERGIRFLLVSTEFKREEEGTQTGFELYRRCRPYFYSGLAQRPRDIPYFFVGSVFRLLPDIEVVRVDAVVLLALAELSLANPNPGKLEERSKQMCEAALSRKIQRNNVLTITYEDFPDASETAGYRADLLGFYEFMK